MQYYHIEKKPWHHLIVLRTGGFFDTSRPGYCRRFQYQHVKKKSNNLMSSENMGNSM